MYWKDATKYKCIVSGVTGHPDPSLLSQILLFDLMEPLVS